MTAHPAVRERGILFSAPLVRAILEGRKSVTRRLIKPQPPEHLTSGRVPWNIVGNLWGFTTIGTANTRVCRSENTQRCPFGAAGDRLWAREAWAHDAPSLEDARAAHEDMMGGSRIYYRATEENPDGSGLRWRPSIHMPRWASRIDLEVTGVSVERLQSITEAEAIAEGAVWTDYGLHCFHNWSGPGPCPAPPEHHAQYPGWSIGPSTHQDQCLHTARFAFGSKWDELHGAGSWASNPWVWRIGFRVVRPARAEEGTAAP